MCSIRISVDNGISDLFTEKMRAASIRTVEKSGVWKVGYEHFNKLQSATVTVVHDCEGLLEG